MPENVRQRLIEVGFSNPYAAMDELYLPILREAPKGDVTITKDISYGPHSRNKLDVYQPPGVSNAPIFVYVHGGGYRSGDRDINEEIYSNVLHYFTRFLIFN